MPSFQCTQQPHHTVPHHGSGLAESAPAELASHVLLRGEATGYYISHLVVREHLDCWFANEFPTGEQFDAIRPVGRAAEDAFLDRAFGLALYDNSGELSPGLFGRTLTCLAAGWACELIEGNRTPSDLARTDAFVAHQVVLGCQGSPNPLEERLWYAAVHQAKRILRNPALRRRRDLLMARRNANRQFMVP